MTTPEEIRTKAARKYRDLLKAWLTTKETDSFFPLRIPFSHEKSGDDYSAVMAWIRDLQTNSKAETGTGYSLELGPRNSKAFGNNEFPEKIYYESRGDFLNAIGQGEAFERFTNTVTTLRTRFPQLEPWFATNVKLTIDIADQQITEGLLAVCQYLQANPRCGLYGRELPIGVDTKFIERHQKILHPWLDLILPSDAIRSDEDHFERRFGIGYPEPLIRLRFLDAELQSQINTPFNHLALPLTDANEQILIQKLNPKPTIYVVENLVPALTLPDKNNAIVMAGLGGFVNLFRYIKWLHDCPEIVYWGDIDIHGFQILSQFRRWFPQVRSLMMNQVTFDQFPEYVVDGKPSHSDTLLNLTEEESCMAERCRSGNLRLEQEKIPQSWVIDHDGL